MRSRRGYVAPIPISFFQEVCFAGLITIQLYSKEWGSVCGRQENELREQKREDASTPPNSGGGRREQGLETIFQLLE
jgi:hypothetical protein